MKRHSIPQHGRFPYEDPNGGWTTFPQACREMASAVEEARMDEE